VPAAPRGRTTTKRIIMCRTQYDTIRYVYLTIYASSGRKAWKTWVHVKCLGRRFQLAGVLSDAPSQARSCQCQERASGVRLPVPLLFSSLYSSASVFGAFALFFLYHTPLFIVSVSEWPLSLVDLRLLPIYPIRPTHSPSPKPGIDHHRGMTQMHVLLRTTSASFSFPCLLAGDIYLLSWLRYILER
jgi:hypothetical protein